MDLIITGIEMLKNRLSARSEIIIDLIVTVWDELGERIGSEAIITICWLKPSSGGLKLNVNVIKVLIF